MTADFLTQNWSLVIAGVLLTGIALFVLYRVFSDSARGQLRRRVRDLASRYREFDKASRAAEKAHRKLQRLGGKVATVKPRHLDEAREALEDARSLLKIAEDQVLIAENHVRKVIVEEFPPKRQGALRERHLRRPEDRTKPFTF